MKRKSYLRTILGFVFVGFTAGMVFEAASQQQYKRISREWISMIQDEKTDQVIQEAIDYLREHPEDTESYFVLTVAYTQQGDIKKAMDNVERALENGLPFDRFLAGPRTLLKPLYENDDFQAMKDERDPGLIHGPMLGCVTEQSASFWVRTVDEQKVQIHISQKRNMDNAIASDRVTTQASKDYTAIASVDGLQPNTTYYYTIELDGTLLLEQYSFKTYPKQGDTAQFHVGFGGGAGYTPQYEHMWTTLKNRDFLAFLLLGDNVYIDHPKEPDTQRYCYYRRQSRPEFSPFIATSSIYAIWDDHDFTTNDSWGGPEIDNPAWKRDVWNLFKNNWNNPYYAGGEEQPGCWFDFSIGDVDFILLDGRYYRTDPKVDNPRMLGPAQMEWLKKTLKESEGTFKVLASPVPWAYGSKPGSLDPWQGYKEERKEIFSFIKENEIDGVFLISADRHRSDCWIIEDEAGYPLYEFESSKLSNIHTHGIMPGSLFGYNDKCSFGTLIFDTTKEDPTVSYEIRSIDDELIHKITVKRSQIMN